MCIVFSDGDDGKLLGHITAFVSGDDENLLDPSFDSSKGTMKNPLGTLSWCSPAETMEKLPGLFSLLTDITDGDAGNSWSMCIWFSPVEKMKSSLACGSNLQCSPIIPNWEDRRFLGVGISPKKLCPTSALPCLRECMVTCNTETRVLQ